MNKKLALSFSLICAFGIKANNKSNLIIPNASYVICDGFDPYSRGYIITDDPFKYVTAKAYTFDGKLIDTKKFNSHFSIIQTIKQMIDPKAAKPRPVKFRIVYHFGKIGTGHYIIFYDKNDNLIDSFKYDGDKSPKIDYLSSYQSKSMNQPFGQIFDLSDVKQEKPWYKFW